MEYYMEIFSFTTMKGKVINLHENIRKSILLRVIREDYLEALNLMSGGGVKNNSIEEIFKFYKNYSRIRGS